MAPPEGSIYSARSGQARLPRAGPLHVRAAGAMSSTPVPSLGRSMIFRGTVADKIRGLTGTPPVYEAGSWRPLRWVVTAPPALR